MAGKKEPRSASRDTPMEIMHRLSLLDVVWERAKAFNKKALIHRLVCIGKLNTDLGEKKRDVGEYYEKFFKNSGAHAYTEGVTGLLLVYPQHFLHVIESSTGVLVDTIKDLEAKVKRGNFIKESKILLMVGNIPSRLYSQWNYRVLNLPAIRTDEQKLAESTENLLSEALALTLKIGHQLTRVPKSSLKTALDQLDDKYREMLIPQDIIDKLLQAQELCNPGQYLQKYYAPLDVTLDRDLVWPAETKLFPL
eukprot:Seg1116.7 transcript_id=Seg1116.7/GoldUCD/mRNA.D3Y31 product="Testis-expressed protein 47" protein_id=Seg1116.7/GoldUCD/D3Y31